MSLDDPWITLVPFLASKEDPVCSSQWTGWVNIVLMDEKI